MLYASPPACAVLRLSMEVQDKELPTSSFLDSCWLLCPMMSFAPMPVYHSCKA